ncbi:MAG: RNA-guided endonuclease IscB [Nitrospirae bacterium]|nr:RNA-guided endonuclease IscB [Nitrospirota bacterium]
MRASLSRPQNLGDRGRPPLSPRGARPDPGSKTTGFALVREEEVLSPETGKTATTAHVLFLGELTHRGGAIRDRLTVRRACRRRRRSKLRHRAPRFDNRTKPEGWLAPSLQHRVDTTTAWVERFRKLAPVSGISQELVQFDLQKMEAPEISGAEYQQGTLAGYEVREYLLEKWGRVCAYCGKKNVPLEIDHIYPRSKGGSDRVANLTLSCRPCNRQKGNRDVAEFLKKKPEVRARILAKDKAPLRDVSAVNATRWALFRALQKTGLPVEQASGGRTKWNRSRFGLPKTHALDAACVGAVDRIEGGNRPVLSIKATGRGAYQRTRLDSFGFARGILTRKKAHFGFATGDLVRAVVTKGKKAGTWLGRVAVRRSGSFNIQTGSGVVQGISHKLCRLLQRADGYGYSLTTINRKEGAFLPGVNAEASNARKG